MPDGNDTTVEAIDRYNLAEVQTKWEKLHSACEGLACESADQQKWWGRLLADAQEALVAIEADRRVLILPILESQRAVNAAFKKASDAAEGMKTLAKEKLAAARERALATRTEVLASVEAAAARGDSEAVLAGVALIPEEVVTKGAGGGWTWEPTVVDAAAVPDEFRIVDTKKLAAYAKAFSKSETIPAVAGVVFKRTAKVIAGKK
jgi:hypothetical protein